jgi:hypothetical protein
MCQNPKNSSLPGTSALQFGTGNSADSFILSGEVLCATVDEDGHYCFAVAL